MKMDLAVLIDGEAFIVCEDIDQYNLDKPMAQSSVCHDIKQELTMHVEDADA